MSQPTHTSSHEVEGSSLVPAQFSEKKNFQSFLGTWLGKAQEIEDVFYDGLFQKHLYLKMSGYTLDKLAHLFGLKRSVGETDDELRRRVVGEIMKRSSDGTPDRIREIISALIPIKNLRIFEHYPSSLYLYGFSDMENFSFKGVEADYVKDAAPVGTGSTVLGFIKGSDTSHLFIPSEIEFQLKNSTVTAPQPSDTDLNPLFDWNLVTPDGGGGFNQLVVRDNERVDTSDSSNGNFANAILPEIGYRRERFIVQTTQGSEEASVDTITGVEDFLVDNEGVENDKGIMLEIVQHKIDIGTPDPIPTNP